MVEYQIKRKEEMCPIANASVSRGKDQHRTSFHGPSLSFYFFIFYNLLIFFAHQKLKKERKTTDALDLILWYLNKCKAHFNVTIDNITINNLIIQLD